VATEAQLAFFKGLYDEEQARYLNLVDRGKTYLSIATLYFSALAIVADKTHAIVSALPKAAGLYLIGVGVLATSMGLILAAIGIMRYVYPCDAYRIITDAKMQLLSEKEFREKRILEYAAATHTNAKKNEHRATLLRFASFALLGGILVHSLVIFWITLP
jgi:hypothetical protein